MSTKNVRTIHANISKNRVRQVHYDTSNYIVLRHNTTRHNDVNFLDNFQNL